MWQNYEKVIDPLPRSGELKKQNKLNSFDHFDETQIDKECNYEKPAKKKNPLMSPLSLSTTGHKCSSTPTRRIKWPEQL